MRFRKALAVLIFYLFQFTHLNKMIVFLLPHGFDIEAIAVDTWNRSIKIDESLLRQPCKGTVNLAGIVLTWPEIAKYFCRRPTQPGHLTGVDTYTRSQVSL